MTSARDGEKFLTALESYKEREKEIKEDGIRLKNDIESLQKLAENLPNLEKEFNETEAELRRLNNPRERAEALKKEAQTEAEIKDKQRKIEKALEELDRERLEAGEKFGQFSEVETLLKKFQSERDQTLSAHREFLANESLANSFPNKEKDLLEATVKVESLQKEAETSFKKLNEVEQKYDRERHQTEKAALLNLKTSEAESKAKFDFAKKTEANLQSEIERLQKVREEMKA